ncbi:KH domain containing protein [Gracilaria domingensis]|nr:KH domain containing protein [Gracilaria domingensis]
MDRDPAAQPPAKPAHLDLDTSVIPPPPQTQSHSSTIHPNGSSSHAHASAMHDSLRVAQSDTPVVTPAEHILQAPDANHVAAQLQSNLHQSSDSHSLQQRPASKPLSSSEPSNARTQPPQSIIESAPLETSRPSHHPPPFNMVSSFSDLSLNAAMEYPSTLPIMPIPHQQIIPISPQHVAQVAQQNRRHHQHPLLHNHNQQHTFQLWVPQERVGAVIGGHGAVIRSLQEKSGAAIQVHNDTVREDRKLFTIFGTRAQYETAAQLVNEIVERPRPSSHYPSHHSTSMDPRSHFSSSIQSSNHMSTKSSTSDMCKTVYVPTSCVGLVIGRNGETIKSLQDRSGAEIKVTPDRKAAPGSDDRSILISGTEEAIATAHQLVSEIVNDARSRRPSHHGGLPPGSTYKGQPFFMETLAVPNEKVGLIIGKKGITIRELQMKSGAGIQVAKDDNSVRSDGSRPITITGSRAQVEDAKAMIANKINVNMLTTIHPPTTFQSPLVSTHGMPLAPGQPPGLQYVMPNVYEAEYSNGQMHTFSPVVDLTDPNNSHSRHPPMAYMPYFGYNNVAPLQQHRQFAQQAAQIPFNPALHQSQQPPSSQQQVLHDQTPPPGQPQAEQESQLAAPMVGQAQQQLDGLAPPVNMVGGEANPGFVMFPSPFHPMASQMQHQHIYPGMANTRVFPREAHAQAQMFAHAQAQAQAQAQMHTQPFAQVQPLGSVPPNENAEVSSHLDQQPNDTVQNSAPIPSEIEQPDR